MVRLFHSFCPVLLAYASLLASDAPVATTNGIFFLRNATKRVDPAFPSEALRQGKSGVAVAELCVGAEGAVTSVIVVEAPSPAIGRAVSDALSQWRFAAPEQALKGKLIYYFVIENGKGRVLGAPDAVEQNLKMVRVRPVAIL